LFLVANRDIYKTINIASICISIFRELENINIIIALINIINSLYIDKSLNSN